MTKKQLKEKIEILKLDKIDLNTVYKNEIKTLLDNIAEKEKRISLINNGLRDIDEKNAKLVKIATDLEKELKITQALLKIKL